MNKLVVILIALTIVNISSADWGEGGWRGEGWGGWRGEGWRRPGPWGPRPWGPRPWSFYGEGPWRYGWGKREVDFSEANDQKREMQPEDMHSKRFEFEDSVMSSPNRKVREFKDKDNQDDSVSLRAVTFSGTDEQPQQAECRFFSDRSKLVCNSGVVECETVSRMSDFHPMFEMFGIVVPAKVETPMRFRLYPKNLTDVTYVSNVVDRPTGKLVELNLFYSSGDNVSNEFGLFVKEKQCYERVVDFFKSFRGDISVDSVNSKKQVSKVSLLGYIIYV